MEERNKSAVTRLDKVMKIGRISVPFRLPCTYQMHKVRTRIINFFKTTKPFSAPTIVQFQRDKTKSISDLIKNNSKANILSNMPCTCELAYKEFPSVPRRHAHFHSTVSALSKSETFGLNSVPVSTKVFLTPQVAREKLYTCFRKFVDKILKRHPLSIPFQLVLRMFRDKLRHFFKGLRSPHPGQKPIHNHGYVSKVLWGKERKVMADPQL